MSEGEDAHEQEPESDSESSSSSDVDMDETQENELRERAASLSKQLEQYPSAYDLHTELITSLRKLGELEKLTAAREHMNSIYPLSPALWLDWIKDARTIACTPEEKRQVECLFKRAIDDYEDVDVWLEYCHFAISNYEPGSDESNAVTQDVFETALSHQGLNVASGTMLWEIYRQFQYLVLARLSKDNNQSVEEHLRKMDKLFRRQLSVPLLNMESTLEEYEQFLKGIGASLYASDDGRDASVPADCLEEYKKAKAQLDALVEFEERIEDAASTKDSSKCASAWEAYLDWAVDLARSRAGAEASGSKRKAKVPTSPVQLSPNQLCCLFERAVTANCLYPAIWIRFINYLEDVLGVDKPRLLRTLARSVRNCPWSVALWLRYALATEIAVTEELVDGGTNGLGEDDHAAVENTAFAKVEAVLEAALRAGLEQESDVVQLWLAYGDYRLRRLLRTQKNSVEWDTQLTNLRGTFDRAQLELVQQFGNNADPEAVLTRYNALIEAKFVGDLGRARSLWSSLMQLPGRGSQAKFWLSYMEFERNWGDVKHFLRICLMAINSISDGADVAFQTMLRLSAEIGVPIGRYQELESRVRSRRRALECRVSEQVTESANPTATHQTEPTMETKTKSAIPRTSGKKRAPVPEKDAVPAKKSKTQQSAPSAPKTHTEKPQPHGEVVPHDPSRDERTVFVSNLDYSVTEDQLRATFESCGQLHSVRLVRDYAGRSKGFAYVEFQQSAATELALAKDRQPVAGTEQPVAGTEPSDPTAVGFARPMFVSRCDPSRTRVTGGFRYVAGQQEPEKLFVRNLDKSVTVEALQKLFGEHGKVVSVRLATYRNGAPKGHAYVEFTNADDASRALIATDGLTLGTKQIAVAISNPPVRNEPKSRTLSNASSHSSDVSEQPTFAVPAAPTSFKPRAHARTQLSFLPRAIHRTPGAESVTSDSNTTSATSTESSGAGGPNERKTNDDFRKMFLSQN